MPLGAMRKINFDVTKFPHQTHVEKSLRLNIMQDRNSHHHDMKETWRIYAAFMSGHLSLFPSLQKIPLTCGYFVTPLLLMSAWKNVLVLSHFFQAVRRIDGQDEAHTYKLVILMKRRHKNIILSHACDFSSMLMS